VSRSGIARVVLPVSTETVVVGFYHQMIAARSEGIQDRRIGVVFRKWAMGQEV
jgi:hypothetical protein